MSIDGGAGNDTLQLNGGGAFDLTIPSVFTGIETILGSTAADTITISASRLAGITRIEGGGGEDTLKLFNAYNGSTFDLRGKTITGFGKIEMGDYWGSVVTLTDKALALQITGYDVEDDELRLEGGTFSADERKILFDHGIDTIVDTGGTYHAAKPQVTGLDETIRLSAGQTARLDVGLNAIVSDADDATVSSFYLYHSILSAAEVIRFASTDQVELSNGMNVGSVISVGAAGSRVQIGTISSWDIYGFGVTFNNDATHARVQELLHALEYANASTDASMLGLRSIDIYLGDRGARQSLSSVTINVVPDNVQVLTSGVDRLAGTAGSDVFAASAITLGEGDAIEGGEGTDTLQALSNVEYGSVLDLTKLATFTGIDIIKMSDAPSDNLTINAAQLAGVNTIEGGAGLGDRMELIGTAFDFTNKTINGFERIDLADRTASVTLNDKALAAVIFGDVYGTASLTLTGTAAFEKVELKALFDHGIKTVNDAAGAHTNKAPVVGGLAGDRIQVSAGATVFVDAGRNATVSDDYSGFAALEIGIGDGVSSGGNNGDRLGFDTSGSVSLSKGLEYGSKVLVNQVEIGSISYTEASFIKVDFKVGTTAEQVQELIRALTCKNERPAGTAASQREITLVLWDTASEASSTKVLVNEGSLAPVTLSLDKTTIKELAATEAEVGRFQITEASPGQTFRFELMDDAGGRFKISADGRALLVANGAKLDYEQATSHSVKVRIIDSTNASFETSLTVTVQNVEPEVVEGTSGHDRFVGGGQDDRLSGKEGNDTLLGGDGHDQISGGLGRDELTGGAGRDIFIFDGAVAKRKNTNIDTITDFDGKNDVFWLDNAIFKGLGKKGSVAKPAKLSKDAFFKGEKAHDASDRIIVSKSGKVFYDADGTGSQTQIQIASLSKSAVKEIGNADFFVI